MSPNPNTDLPSTPIVMAPPASPRTVWIDRNAVINLAVWGLGIALAVTLGPWWLGVAVPLVFFVVTEILYFAMGVSIYSHTNRVRRAYEWFNIYLDGAFGQGRDLTEAYFGDDTSKDGAQAFEDKFDHFIEVLGLEPGHSLLDIGCGYGEFIAHLTARGIDARGVTISPHQAEQCQRRGLDVQCLDVFELPEEFLGRFDAVSFLGCIEHFGNYVDDAERAKGDSFLKRTDRSSHDALLRCIYELAHDCLDADSNVRRVLTSTLHETLERPRRVDWLHGYLVERHYSGLYPLGDSGLVQNSGTWFDEIYRRDATDDYRLSSEIDPLHFGNFNVRWTLRRVLYVPFLALVDPFWMHKWAYHVLGSWMWQFGGIGGLPRDQRPCTLWWFVLEAHDRSTESELDVGDRVVT